MFLCFLLRFFATSVTIVAFLRHCFAGRQRAPEVASRMHARASVFGAALAACAAIFMAASPKLQSHERGVGECSAHVADAQPSHLLGWGPGPVIRRVWTLTCDRETRRPRPRRDGAKPTGAGAPRHWRSGILWLAAAERNCVAVALGSGTLCKTGFPARALYGKRKACLA